MTTITESQATQSSIATTGFLARVARAFVARLRARRALNQLDALDDHMLRDIGLSRADVLHAGTADSATDGVCRIDRARSRGFL